MITPTSHAGSDAGRAARLYTAQALAFLLLTLLAGLWLRTGLLAPRALLGFSYRNLVHAHSHIAFFGWLTMLLFGQLLRPGRFSPRRVRLLEGHAVLTGLASVAAFVAFLRGGYSMPAIAVSATHVGLWVAYVALVWPALGPRGPTGWLRTAALAFLLVAGLATLAPLTILLRGVADPWWNELAVKLFLVPFMTGWLLLGMMAAVYQRCGAPRYGRLALPLIAIGAIPSTLMFVAAPAPHAALVIAGRAGTMLVALATLLFALDLAARARDSAWLQTAAAGAALKGVLELVAAAGLAGTLVRSPPIVLAHLHLVLLGCLTAGLLAVILPRRPRPLPAFVFAAGTAVMLAALAVSGWPRLLGTAMSFGVDLLFLLRAAWLGGAVALLGVLLALAGSRASRPRTIAAAPNRGRILAPIGGGIGADPATRTSGEARDETSHDDTERVPGARPGGDAGRGPAGA